MVVVWSRESGRLVGVVLGERLGAYRTGALGGVAIDLLAAPDASSCAVIGTGLQAITQLLAAASVRRLEHARCFSRTEAGRHAFAERMTEALGFPVEAAPDARSAVAEAEIVLLATRSPEPVVAAADLRPDAHVFTVGPQSAEARELPAELVADCWRIATDSPQQISSRAGSDFLSDPATLSRMEHLGMIESPPRDRAGRTCYLSAGLAATEVLVVSNLLGYSPTQLVATPAE